MPARLGFSLSIKVFSIYSVIVTVFCIFLTQRAQAQTQWTITIDATGSQPKPHGYTVARKDIGSPCSYNNSNSDAPKLKVCGNDIVQWIASTAADSSGIKKNELFIFHEDKVLLDGNKNSIQLLHESDGNAAEGIVDPSAVQPGQDVDHEYYVIVYDRSHKKWYVEDPKIIIGGTRGPQLIRSIQKSCDELSPLLDKHDDLGKEARDKAIQACKTFSEIHVPQK